MSEEHRRTAPVEPCPLPHRTRQPLPDHPVRIALLDLLAETGTITSTEAAARLGHSSGLCSFHLRQLARHGVIEEAPHQGGRARPWRLRWAGPSDGADVTAGAGPDAPEGLAALARGLEDESYQHWLAHRDEAPAEWQHDESFSAVLHLTPDEMADLADSVRKLLDGYRERGPQQGPGSGGAVAVAAVIRLFPLLNSDSRSGSSSDG